MTVDGMLWVLLKRLVIQVALYLYRCNIDYINASSYSPSSGWFYDRIGRGYNSADRFVGHLRNVGIWQEVLTPRKMVAIAENIGRFRADGKRGVCAGRRNREQRRSQEIKGPQIFSWFQVQADY